MAITFSAAASDGALDSSDTSIVVTAPTGTGGQLVAFGVCVAARTIAPPAGWTQVINGGGTEKRMYVWQRADDAAGSYTFTASGNFSSASVAVLRIQGADLSTISATASESTGSDTSAECPSIATTVADSMCLWAAASTNGSTGSINNGATERVDFTGSGHGACLHVYTAIIASPSTPTAPVISTASYGRWVAVSVEVAPTGGGAAPGAFPQPQGGSEYGLTIFEGLVLI